MMKKVYFVLVICLITFSTQTINGQLQFGIKGGLNFSSSCIDEVKSSIETVAVEDAIIKDLESTSSFHAGVWFRIKVPVIGVYVRPELVYTQLKNEFKYKNNLSAFNFQKIDIPILFGKKIFGVGNLFIGPSFQYVLSSDFGLEDLKDIKSDGFTAGLQLGGGIEFWKLGVDVRWERSFSGFESSFLDDTSEVSFDTRVNQIIVGISYRL